MYLDPGSTADDIDPSCKCNIKGQTWEEMEWACECEEGYEINEDGMNVSRAQKKSMKCLRTYLQVVQEKITIMMINRITARRHS